MANNEQQRPGENEGGKPDRRPTRKKIEEMLGPIFMAMREEHEKKVEGSRDKTRKKLMKAIEKRAAESGTALLDGAEAASLAESMRVFAMPFARAVAGTDAGTNYKPKNEDRAGINAEANFAAVADGMGKYGKGADAAQFLVEALLAKPSDVPAAVTDAQTAMGGLPEDDGSAFVSARITKNERGRRFLTVHQAGDARIFVIDAKGAVRFCSKDQGITQEAVDAGFITADEALYHGQRHILRNPIRAKGGKPVAYEPVALRKRDRVYLCSDGISDNLTPEEIAAIAKGKTIEETLAAVSDVTDGRMRRYSNISHEAANGERAEKGRFSDGYLSAPKPDNRALVIMEIL